MIAFIAEWAVAVAVLTVFVIVVKCIGWVHNNQPWRRCPGCGQPDSAHEQDAADFVRWEHEPTVTPGRPS